MIRRPPRSTLFPYTDALPFPRIAPGGRYPPPCPMELGLSSRTEDGRAVTSPAPRPLSLLEVEDLTAVLTQYKLLFSEEQIEGLGCDLHVATPTCMSRDLHHRLAVFFYQPLILDERFFVGLPCDSFPFGLRPFNILIYYCEFSIYRRLELSQLLFLFFLLFCRIFFFSGQTFQIGHHGENLILQEAFVRFFAADFREKGAVFFIVLYLE